MRSHAERGNEDQIVATWPPLNDWSSQLVIGSVEGDSLRNYNHNYTLRPHFPNSPWQGKKATYRVARPLLLAAKRGAR